MRQTPRLTVGLLALLLGLVYAPTLCAQATAMVTGGASSGTMGQETSEWGSAAVWAFLSTSALEWLKRKTWFTAVSENTTWWAQRLVGIVLAAATAAGVHFSFEYDAVQGAATLHATGLAAFSIFRALGETLRQWVMNEVIYRISVKNYNRGETASR